MPWLPPCLYITVKVWAQSIQGKPWLFGSIPNPQKLSPELVRSTWNFYLCCTNGLSRAHLNSVWAANLILRGHAGQLAAEDCQSCDLLGMGRLWIWYRCTRFGVSLSLQPFLSNKILLSLTLSLWFHNRKCLWLKVVLLLSLLPALSCAAKTVWVALLGDDKYYSVKKTPK